MKANENIFKKPLHFSSEYDILNRNTVKCGGLARTE